MNMGIIKRTATILQASLINRKGRLTKEVSKINIYKSIWKVIGGRPWTYILRDLWHKYELVWIIIIFSAGVAMGLFCDIDTIIKVSASFITGYIFGHLFWGKEYIPDQQGEA